jgi:hypothetical protein
MNDTVFPEIKKFDLPDCILFNALTTYSGLV